MSFSLVKAVKSTHRNLLNKLLHLIGLALYASVLISVTLFLSSNDSQNPMLILALWLTAINLFITGHVVEDNVSDGRVRTL